ncbi:MAG: hypothetical protein HC933_08155 [Pleurocapsa sp. SU_196_0]|nr:hypothetical protein [Pleurocapsa sp. SU_196_0]
MIAGQFERRESHVTLVLVSTTGSAPSNAVLSAVYTDLLSRTWFNMTPENPSRPYVHVLGVRHVRWASPSSLYWRRRQTRTRQSRQRRQR